MPAKGRRLVLFLVLAALVTGACSQDAAKEDPKGALIDSIDALQDADSVSVTLSLQASPDSLRSLSAQGDTELSAQDAEKILDSSITITSTKGEDPDSAQAQVIIRVAGTDALEMRFLDQTLFLRTDARSLAEALGQNPASLDALGSQAAASGLDFVEPALQGKWLALTGFDQLAKQFGGGSAAGPSSQQQQFLKDLNDAFKSTAKVTSVGDDDAGTHLVATVPLREIYQKLADDAQSLTGAIPGSLPPASEVPDEDLKLDAWVDGDRLTQLELDLVQFAKLSDEGVPDNVDRLALRVVFNDFEGNIAAPEGAVDVDLQQVIQSFTAGFSGASGSGAATPAGGTIPGTSLTCDDLTQQNPDDIKAFLSSDPQLLDRVAQACPELGLNP